MPDQTYDCLIIGGGPAGWTCALYFARFNRKALVLSSEDQRARLIPRTHNVPGWIEGISGDELIARCREHATRYGAEFAEGEAVAVEGEIGAFRIRMADGREFTGRHVVFATGVEDLCPEVPGLEACEGRGLRYCPICDGYESNGQRLALFGAGDELARHALFMTTFTDRITLMLNGEGRWEEISPALRDQLERKGIRAVEDRVVEVFEEGGEICGFLMEEGERIEVDRAYGGHGLRPRSELARRMNVETNAEGYIKVDSNGATSVRGVYAIGDVVNQDYAQIVIGMGQAAIAAIDIHGEFMAEG